MEKFKFRGLHGKPGQEKYVYGYLTKDQKFSTAYYDTHSYRISWYDERGAYNSCPVRNGTVEQCTGIESMSGEFIYFGDVVYIAGQGNTVIDDQGYFDLFERCITGNEDDIGDIIGNITQNPELLDI